MLLIKNVVTASCDNINIYVVLHAVVSDMFDKCLASISDQLIFSTPLTPVKVTINKKYIGIHRQLFCRDPLI